MSYLGFSRFAVILLLVTTLTASCDKRSEDLDFCRERIEGRYAIVDSRKVEKSPEPGYDTFTGTVTVKLNDDRSAQMVGSWSCSGRLVGLNMKMDSFTVEKEDGTSLHYQMGIVESSRTLYKLDWDYVVNGTVMNDYGEIVDYYAKGHVEARRTSAAN